MVAVAVRWGLGPSLVAVLAASLSYNFFFLPPVYTFTIADPTNVAAFLLFTLVAVLVSNLGAHARRTAVASQARARATERLYGFSRKLAGCGTLDDVLWATSAQVAAMLRVRVVLLLPEGPVRHRARGLPAGGSPRRGRSRRGAVVIRQRPAGGPGRRHPAGRQAPVPAAAHRPRGTLGVIGLDADRTGPILTPEGRRLLDALTDMGALAIERVRLVEDLDRAERAAETDRLRQALLTSISHDLRTPLSSVLGAATTLRDLDEVLPREAKGELLGSIIEESERPEPVHRQPARHDAPRGRCRLAQPRAAGRGRERRYRPAPRGGGAGGAPGDGRRAAGPADPAARSGPVRAGSGQPARQRRQIRSALGPR